MEEFSSTDSQNNEMPVGLLSDQDLMSLAEVEQRYIRYVLKKVQGNKRRAAGVLGIGRRTLYRRLGEDMDTEEEGTKEP